MLAINWLIDCFTAHQHRKAIRCQETLLNKIWSSFVDKYNCVWRNADWPTSRQINTKSYQWQWKCGCSLTSYRGHHSVWMQFSVMPRTMKMWPQTGQKFNIKCCTKIKYKLAIRDAYIEFEDCHGDLVFQMILTTINLLLNTSYIKNRWACDPVAVWRL